jgi:propionyl-CoA carboxylase beta chain
MGNDVALAWPGSKIAVMGAPGAVQILHQRHLSGLDAGAATAERERLEADYATTHLTPDDALRRGYVDAVVEPADTRPALCRALGTLLGKRSPGSARKHHNGPL